MIYFKIENGKATTCQTDINGFSGTWIEESYGFYVGDLYTEENGWSHPIITEEEARRWRDNELQSTDYILPLTDYPTHSAILTYRQELRDWPSTEDFPNIKPIKQ